MHGFVSLGTVAGAAIGMLLTAAASPVTWHLFPIGLVSVPVALITVRAIPYGVGLSLTGASRCGATDGWLIGVIVVAMALAEGAANDWRLIMVDGHRLDAAWGSAVYPAFAAAMAIGRFGGGWFRCRYSRATVLGATLLVLAAAVAPALNQRPSRDREPAPR